MRVNPRCGADNRVWFPGLARPPTALLFAMLGLFCARWRLPVGVNGKEVFLIRFIWCDRLSARTGGFDDAAGAITRRVSRMQGPRKSIRQPA